MITRTTPITLDELPEMARVPLVAELLDVSEGAVRAEIKAGRLGHVRVGRLIRIPKDAIRDWMRAGGAQ